MRIAVTRANLVTLGTRAALIADAASPTPRSTSAQEPDDTREAVIRTKTAVIMPATAMKALTAFPAG